MPHPLQSPAPRRAGDANKIEYILTARFTGIKNLKKMSSSPSPLREGFRERS